MAENSSFQQIITWLDARENIIDKQGKDFDDMPSYFPCKIDDANQYINLG